MNASRPGGFPPSGDASHARFVLQARTWVGVRERKICLIAAARKKSPRPVSRGLLLVQQGLPLTGWPGGWLRHQGR
jgi:hypothetical protein